VTVTKTREYLINAVGLDCRIDQLLHKLPLQILWMEGILASLLEAEPHEVKQTSRKNFLAPTLRAFSLAAS